MELNRFSILSDEDLAKINEASLKVLSGTGVYVWSDKILKVFEDSDARIDRKNRIVRIPKRLVEECLSSLPSRFYLYDRNKKPSIKLGSDTNYIGCAINAPYILDFETGQNRKVTKEDVATFAKIVDAVENVHIMCIPGMPQNVSPKASLLHGAAAALNNTEKHIYFATESLEITKAMYEIAKVVIDEEDLSRFPLMSVELSPISPLSWGKGASEALLETAALGVPVSILPQPYTGVTAPYTLAGLLVVNNAEFLSGMVITQLVRKGTPVIYGASWTTFDMRIANVVAASPESFILRIAGTQLAKYYRIPMQVCGFSSDSMCQDEQTGWEKALSAFTALGSEADISIIAGMWGNGYFMGFEQLVIDNELAGLLFRLFKGMEVSPDTMAIDVIQKVGCRGNFLQEDHTLKHLRTGEHWQSRLANHMGYESWRQKNSPTIMDRAREEVLRIVGHHQPKKLDPRVRKEIDQIIEKFEHRDR